VFRFFPRHSDPRRAGRARAVIAGGAALIAAGSALAACSGAASSFPASAGSPAVPYTTLPNRTSGQVVTPPGAAEVGVTVSPAALLIVRTGSLTLQLRPGAAMRVFDEVSGQVNALGGFVSSSATAGATTASLVLRVPSDEFSKLVDEISGDGHLVSEQLNGQDVTGETINLRAQITNLTAEEQSLRTLMSRAGSIPSILEVQNQLFSVEGEIEQLAAQESSLLNQATFATLNVALRAPLAHAPRGQGAIGRAVSIARRNTVAAVRGVVVALGWAFPAAVVALLAGGVLWIRRRRRESGTGGASPAPVGAP
jgi:Ca-activated chloride channel family protein